MKLWTIMGVLSFAIMSQTFAQSVIAAEAPSSSTEIQWQTKDIEKSLASAKTDGKHVFLYWGAQWCPPCNAMKAEVFSRIEFQAAIQKMIPIMIDGDSDDAQKWSERFQVTGYPTTLVLSPDGNERMRFYGYVPLTTILPALSAIELSSDSLAETLKKARSSLPLSESEWRQLAYSDWSRFTGEDAKSPVELALDLTKLIPEKLTVEKALLANYVVLNATEASPELLKKIRDQYDVLFASIALNQGTRQTAQVLFVEGLASLKLFTEGDVPAEQKKQRVAAWATAVENLSKEMGD